MSTRKVACGAAILAVVSTFAGIILCLVAIGTFSDSRRIQSSTQSALDEARVRLEQIPNPAVPLIVEEVTESLIREVSPRVQKCISNFAACPKLPDGQLESDWRVRYQKQERIGCYFEFKGVKPRCPQLCEELFLRDSLNPDVGANVYKACAIGCSYAVKAVQNAKHTCLRDCKATVWKFDAADDRCRGNRGLGLAVEGLEIEKACEIGCLIGNERPCPQCDARAINAATVEV